MAKTEAETQQKHALEIANAEEKLKITEAKLNEEERLIALFEKGLWGIISSKPDPFAFRLTRWGGRSAVCKAVWGGSKSHFNKIQLKSGSKQRNSSLFEETLNVNAV